MDMGRDNGGVVDLDYEDKAPYAFTGTLDNVVFDLAPHDHDDELFATRDGGPTQIQSWIALFCTSATGIVLCIFPVAVIRRLSKEQITLSSADRRATKQIKILGRLLGVIFLTAAVLIARSLR